PRSPGARSESTRLQREHDGEDPGPIARHAETFDGPAHGSGLAGLDSRRGRHLRRNELQRHSAHARDWYSHGHWSAAARRFQNGDRTGNAARLDWRCFGFDRRFQSDAFDEDHALRRRPNRSGNVRKYSGNANGRGTRGLLRARQARDESRPVGGAAIRVRNQEGMKMTLWQDFRYAARSLHRHTVLSLTVLATLTLGIGVNAAVFTLINADALRPHVNKDPDSFLRVHAAYTKDPAHPGYPGKVTLEDYLAFKGDARSCD